MAEPGLRAPTPLAPEHDIAGFASGKTAMDDWLHQRARRSEGLSARTFVVCRGNAVVGYYTLAAGAVARAAATGRTRRNMPEQIPVMILARLAVDERHSRRGIGAGMLRDAILRTLTVAETAGIRALLVHALDDEAVGFYCRYGFTPSPLDERTLMLPLEVGRAALP